MLARMRYDPVTQKYVEGSFTTSAKFAFVSRWYTQVVSNSMKYLELLLSTLGLVNFILKKNYGQSF